MTKNTPELWDSVWESDWAPEQDKYDLAKEERGIRWRRIERIIREELASFEGLKVIEIGAGAGTNAALMAKRSATVTLVDYSSKALERARHFFAHNRLEANLLREDVLALPDHLLGGFDVAMSFGLTEHFSGDDRLAVNRAHFDLVRPGGLVFISVPNKWNPPYRIYKLVAQALGRWKVGEEYPYSRRELARLCEQLGVRQYRFFGDSTWGSLRFVNPLRIASRLRGTAETLDPASLRPERGSFLDPYLAYALVLCGKKP
ncbi:MAG: class I SAM-dependent methyltransferase [Gemmatimonadota bacterium]|nr:MAG: class I SAM-dependent methyltransferase [Gemmatimonadota bacterium]